jgi:hypothetical protein
MKRYLALLLMLLPSPGLCNFFTNVPYSFTNGPTFPFVPSQMMADYASIISQGNGAVGNLQNELSTLAPFKSGSIVMFWQNSCPTGWTYFNVAGYYIRGADLGRGLDTTGVTTGGSEGSTLQLHGHSASGTWVASTSAHSGVSCTHACSSNTPVVTSLSYSVGTFNSSSAGSGSSSNPKHVALLFCVKN